METVLFGRNGVGDQALAEQFGRVGTDVDQADKPLSLAQNLQTNPAKQPSGPQTEGRLIVDYGNVFEAACAEQLPQALFSIEQLMSEIDPSFS
jgi:hypothetical protein